MKIVVLDNEVIYEHIYKNTMSGFAGGNSDIRDFSNLDQIAIGFGRTKCNGTDGANYG